MNYRRIRPLAALLAALVMLSGIAGVDLPPQAYGEEIILNENDMLSASDVLLAEVLPEDMEVAEDIPAADAGIQPGAVPDIPAAEDAAQDMEAEMLPTMEPAPELMPEAAEGAQAMTLSYSYAVRSSRDPLAEIALPIIIDNEGSYTSVNANDNGALSIGKIQWHAGRALSLMRRIVSMDPDQAYEILGPELYNEVTSKSTNWGSRVVNASEKALISELLGTSEGREAQDDQALDDVSDYLEHGREKGLVSPGALIYFADIENQNGAGGSGRIGNTAVAGAGSGAKVTLDYIHQVALADEKVGRYAKRRTRTYNKIKALGLDEVEGPEYITPAPTAEPTPDPDVPVVEGLFIRDVDYPATYIINNIGYTVRSGVIESDVKLSSLTIDIQNAEGISVDGMPRTWALSGRTQLLSAFDDEITFSRIREPGAYCWIISARDSAGRSEELRLDFVAVRSGGDAAATPVPTATPKPAPTAVAVERIELSSESLRLQKGDVDKLTAEVFPENAADKGVIWDSSNHDVASVFGGYVLGMAPGEAVISCASRDGGALAECRVTVTADAPEATKEPEATKTPEAAKTPEPTRKPEATLPPEQKLPEEISVIVPEGCLGRGESVQLEVEFIPEGSYSALEWRSKDDSIVHVDENGVVTGMKTGTTTVYVRSENGLIDSLKVKVVKPDVVAAVYLDHSGTITLNLGETLQLEAKAAPSTAETAFKWSSSSASKVKVDSDGLVTAKKTGTATITVKSENGKKDTVKIRVVDPTVPTGVTLNYSGTVTLELGETLQLEAALEPVTAESELKWSSSSASKVKVDSDGLVTAKKEGTATITVRTENGKKDTVKIRVVDPTVPTGVTLNYSGTVTLELGETLQLEAMLEPVTAESELKWSSSSSRARVDADGLVTAKRKGSATITVKTENGEKDTVKIKVISAD